MPAKTTPKPVAKSTTTAKPVAKTSAKTGAKSAPKKVAKEAKNHSKNLEIHCLNLDQEFLELEATFHQKEISIDLSNGPNTLDFNVKDASL